MMVQSPLCLPNFRIHLCLCLYLCVCVVLIFFTPQLECGYNVRNPFPFNSIRWSFRQPGQITKQIIKNSKSHPVILQAPSRSAASLDNNYEELVNQVRTVPPHTETHAQLQAAAVNPSLSHQTPASLPPLQSSVSSHSRSVSDSTSPQITSTSAIWLSEESQSRTKKFRKNLHQKLKDFLLPFVHRGDVCKMADLSESEQLAVLAQLECPPESDLVPLVAEKFRRLMQKLKEKPSKRIKRKKCNKEIRSNRAHELAPVVVTESPLNSIITIAQVVAFPAIPIAQPHSNITVNSGSVLSTSHEFTYINSASTQSLHIPSPILQPAYYNSTAPLPPLPSSDAVVNSTSLLNDGFEMHTTGVAYENTIHLPIEFNGTSTADHQWDNDFSDFLRNSSSIFQPEIGDYFLAPGTPGSLDPGSII